LLSADGRFLIITQYQAVSPLEWKKTMIRKEITLNGKTYPACFYMKTILGYEEITGNSFFTNDFSQLRDRIALIVAAILSADSKENPSIEDLMNADTIELVKEILVAYNIVSAMATEFFTVPEIEPKEEAEKKEGDDTKN
jgi:hypothetical protein